MLFTRFVFLYAVVKGQKRKSLSSVPAPIPNDEGWSAISSQQLCCRKPYEFVKPWYVKRCHMATEPKSYECTKLSCTEDASVENSGFEPLTSTLQK